MNPFTIYEQAFEAHRKAVESSVHSNDEVRKTHYALLKAKEEMRAYERQLLQDTELIPMR